MQNWLNNIAKLSFSTLTSFQWQGRIGTCRCVRSCEAPVQTLLPAWCVGEGGSSEGHFAGPAT